MGFGFQINQALNGLTNGLVIGEHAAQPALIHIGHANPGRLLGNHLGCCTLRTNEHDFLALGRHVAHFDQRFIERRKGFLKIDDVNLVTSTKDKWCHFRVPETGLVAKVHASGQHVSHTYSHFFYSGLAICHASQIPTERAS